MFETKKQDDFKTLWNDIDLLKDDIKAHKVKVGIADQTTVYLYDQDLDLLFLGDYYLKNVEQVELLKIHLKSLNCYFVTDKDLMKKDQELNL